MYITASTYVVIIRAITLATAAIPQQDNNGHSALVSS